METHQVERKQSSHRGGSQPGQAGHQRCLQGMAGTLELPPPGCCF